MSIVKTPENAIKKGFLTHIYQERKSIGIIIEQADCSQISFDAIHAAYKFLKKGNRVELVFFAEDIVKPFAHPPCGLYPVVDLVNYRGNIIAPTLNGVVDAIRIPTIKKVIWYFCNPHELNIYKPEEVNFLMTNEKVMKVCSCEQYLTMIKGMFPNIVNLENWPIKNFDLDQLYKLIY